MAPIDKEKLKKIGELLTRKNETVAVAESVTSGLLQWTFSCIPDASTFFQGGVTAYNAGQKYRHLQVEPIHALANNCVSPKVAVEMALNVCDLFKSDWGIGTTGYAAPVPESEGKLFAYFAIAHVQKVIAKGKIQAREKDPQKVQQEFVDHVVEQFVDALNKG